ncbi:MAG: DUF2089 domain-containing protein [Thermotogae bacterium]|nr:DUF2089 domain-containing protein [Thermotogota bacterium]
MAKRSLTICPVCGGNLEIKVLACPTCNTEIHGTFKHNPFGQLTDEMANFLYEFLKSKGNFSELARKFGVSYPTVRAKYDQLLKILGIEEDS